MSIPKTPTSIITTIVVVVAALVIYRYVNDNFLSGSGPAV